MKSLALLSVFLFSFVALPSDDILRRERISSEQDKAEFFLKLGKKYDPDAFRILNSLDNPKEFTRYARESKTRTELLGDWNTVVHESAHGYDFDLADWGEKAYYIGDDIVIHVPKGRVFNSSEMVSTLPKNLKQDIMRFEPYISGDIPNLTSQVSGVYGLLEEMNAYYHGTKASIALYDYYRSFCPDENFECWGRGYLHEPSTTWSALHEFRLFIGWYLQFAKKKHPDVYAETMGNRSLRVAYTLVDQRFEDINLEFFSIRKEQILKMNKAGINVYVSKDGFLMHRNKNGSASGVGTFDNYNQELKALMTPSLQRQLDYFKVQGLTSENYTEFLTGN